MKRSSRSTLMTMVCFIWASLNACGTQVGNPSGSDDQSKKNSETHDHRPMQTESAQDDGGGSHQHSVPNLCASVTVLSSPQEGISSGKISVIVSSQATGPTKVITTHPDLSTSVGSITTPTVVGTYHFLITLGTSASCFLSTEVNETNLNSEISITVEVGK